MVRVIASSVVFFVQIVDVVFSLFGMIVALIGAGIALALCVGMIGGLVAVCSFLLALLR